MTENASKALPLRRARGRAVHGDRGGAHSFHTLKSGIAFYMFLMKVVFDEARPINCSQLMSDR
jgi:hypothetical protein